MIPTTNLVELEVNDFYMAKSIYYDNRALFLVTKISSNGLWAQNRHTMQLEYHPFLDKYAELSKVIYVCNLNDG